MRVRNYFQKTGPIVPEKYRADRERRSARPRFSTCSCSNHHGVHGPCANVTIRRAPGRAMLIFQVNITKEGTDSCWTTRSVLTHIRHKWWMDSTQLTAILKLDELPLIRDASPKPMPPIYQRISRIAGTDSLSKKTGLRVHKGQCVLIPVHDGKVTHEMGRE